MDKEKQLITLANYIMDFKKRRVHPWDLGLRAKRGLSSMSAYRTKTCVNIMATLTDEEIARFEGIEDFKNYILRFKEILNDQKKKESLKNIDKNDKFINIIETLKKEIEPIIVEQQEKIAKYAWTNWERMNKEFAELGEQAFTEKYGRKDYYSYRDRSKFRWSLSSYRRSYPGSLLNLPEKYVQKDIESRQKAYADAEYAKVNKLIAKLAQRYPFIDDMKLTGTNKSVSGIEFTMSANIDGKPVRIDTSTIYAGGYNIQRLHLRWLLHVINLETGKTMASIRGN